MALLGTLKGFGVTEIFQLISQQMKTGNLILTSQNAKVTIAFMDGMIRGLTSDKWEIDPRADVLLKSGYINEKEFKAAFENEKKNQSTWYEILISKGKLQPTFLDKATNVAIRTTLLDVFQWGEGIYRFEDWDLGTEGLLTCNLPTEAIILDTLRCIDEWPLIKPKIPPVEYCPVTITPLTEEHVKNYDLSSVETNIFDLIDGEKSVEVIVKESLETHYDALKAFVKLMDAGLVEVFPRGTKDQRTVNLAKLTFFRYAKVTAVYISLILCILALMLVGNPRILHPFQSPMLKAQIQDQRLLSEKYATLGIKPSALGTDTYGR
jgi:hypothetical protein